MTEYAFCPTCNDSVEFETVEYEGKTKLDGKTYHYPAKQAVCKICGSDASYAPFQQEMGIAFGDAVRQGQGIVSLEVVRDMPKRYRIGKRPLSLLLGWGEITYSRFVDGAVPSKSYSDVIQALYDNPFAYSRLLNDGKERITAAAYGKSYEAVSKIIANDYPDSVRVFEIAEMLLSLSFGDLTNMTVQKLVYYVQGFSSVLCNQPIFSQMPRAWAAGPVYGQLWHELKDNPDFYRRGLDVESPFAPEEERLIHAVSDAFGCYSGPVLSKFTHNEAPWANARLRAGVKDGEQSSEPLLLEDMKSYFGGIVAKYGITHENEIWKYSQAMAKMVLA